jgi:hypothetical protein
MNPFNGRSAFVTYGCLNHPAVSLRERLEPTYLVRVSVGVSLPTCSGDSVNHQHPAIDHFPSEVEDFARLVG